MAIAHLERALATRPAHAYAFIGPASVGKETLAFEFAAALNCTADEKPCGECRSCRDTLANRHADVELVALGGICDEPEHKDHVDARELRICQVRRLQRVLSLAPYGEGRRVAIIDATDTLRPESANAFLKTLEEPPAETVIILLVEREERLPATIFSRCQRVSFSLVDREIIRSTLIERGADKTAADAIVAAAAGRMGWALRALAEPELLSEREQILDDAVAVAHASRADRFLWAQGARNNAESRDGFLRALDVWESWWRDVLLVGAGGEAGIANRDRESLLHEEGKLYQAGEVATFLRALLQTREWLQSYVDPQLALENLTLDLPRPASLLPSR